MSLQEIISKVESMFGAIPIVIKLRAWHKAVGERNRMLGYLINWLAHYGVCVAATLVACVIGLVAGSWWWGAFAGATIALVFYTIREAPGFYRKVFLKQVDGAPWWDHVGDWVGPLICWIQVLLLS